MERFKSGGKAATDYGISQDKLVMGAPLYGTTGAAGEQAAYLDFVGKDNLINTSTDTWSYEGENYTPNSQNTVRQKMQCVCENGFGGVMSQDLITDVDVTHEISLLKAVKEELDCYANPTVG